MINWSIFSLQRNTNKFVRKLVDASNNFRFTWTGLNQSALCLPWTNMCNMKTRQRSNSYMYTGVYYSKSNDPLSNYTNSWYIPQNAMHFLCRVVNVVLQIVYNEAQSIVRDRSFVLDQYISCDNNSHSYLLLNGHQYPSLFFLLFSYLKWCFYIRYKNFTQTSIL